MGAVSFSVDRRVLESLKEALPLGVFVETGTFEGDSALLAVHVPAGPHDRAVYFTPRVAREFKARFADVLIATGYERDRTWGPD